MSAPNTPDERRRAARVVAARVVDRDERAEVLRMLGIGDEPNVPENGEPDPEGVHRV